MSNGESRSDYGWRSAWGRSSRSSGQNEHGQPQQSGVESSTFGTDDVRHDEPPPPADNPGWNPSASTPSIASDDRAPDDVDTTSDADTSQVSDSAVDGPDGPTSDDSLSENDQAEAVPTGQPEAVDDATAVDEDAVDEDAADQVALDGVDGEAADEAPEDVAPAASPVEPEPPLRRRPLPRVIALANQKGGVGKTTTTINLGAALAEDDHRTLIIDLDPQGNATTGLGINSRALDYSIYDVLLAEVPLEDCVESTSVRNLFIAPASLDLAGAEIELVPAMSREMRLRNAISRVKDDYDYILIDCPPSLGLLTVNALAAADEVMVPIQCEYYALEGLGQLIRNINLVQKNLNTTLELSSIILVMYDGRTKLAEQVSTEVREHFGNVVCRNVIPRNIRLSEAPSYGQPITTFDPSSRGAVAYRELAREVHRVSS